MTTTIDKMEVDNLSEDTLMWTEKYRPSSLNEIISQDAIINTLKVFIETNKLPHLLFYGPPGSGKTSTVVAIAKQLYGDKYQSHVLELNASDERGIDIIRKEIKGFASAGRLFDSKMKLIILDEADQMTKDSQNALRRVIEQYAKNVRFCILCNYVNHIIPAIQSRCTKFRFSPLKRKSVEKFLSQVSQNEQVEIEEEAIKTIVRLSNGDMRKSLMILQNLSLYGKKITEADIYQSTGKPSREDMKQIVTQLIQSDFENAFKTISDLKQQKGLALDDIITGIFAFVSKFSLPISEEAHQYILEQLADLEYNLSFGCSEKIHLSGLIGAFQIATQTLQEPSKA